MIGFVYTQSMDVFAEREGQLFVWDSDKARLNHRKHGITFERAMEVIADPLAIFEDASVSDERREAAIGLDLSESLLFVIHVLREGDMMRLISARAATGRERRRYEEFA